MRCLSCKTGEMIDSVSTYFIKVNGCYVIIENVPCKKCEQCGDEYFSTSVVERIDDILEKIENIASKIFIMDYREVA